jgi:hypothetical protein
LGGELHGDPGRKGRVGISRSRARLARVQEGSALGYGPNWPIKGPFVCLLDLFGCTSRSFNSQIALCDRVHELMEFAIPLKEVSKQFCLPIK